MVEEVDNGNLVYVMMVDLSAAFDMVDHDMLLKKLEQFGLDSEAIAWMAEARVSCIVAQYHVRSHIVMGVGEQDVMWMTVLSAWLEQILWSYLEQYQDTSHQHYLSSQHSALALTIARQT